MHYVKLYIQFIKIRLSSIVAYRGSFITGAVAQILTYGAGFFTTWLLVDAFKELNGWTPYEVLLLYGMNLFSYALAAFFLFNTAQGLEQLVVTGGLDGVLLKPVNTFLYLICNGFNTGYFSHITLSVLTIVISFSGLGIKLSPIMIIMLLLSIIGGALIQGAALIMTAVPTIWMLKGNFSNIFYWSMKTFINYPISLYNKIVQVILTFILPYAFINFYPAQLFLGKEDYVFHASLQYAALPVGLIFFFLAYRFWLYGINKYQGTGT
jgi:ABC-2 type transport system permease protein